MMSNNLHVLYIEDDLQSRKIMELLLTQIMGVNDFTMFDTTYKLAEKLEAIDSAINVVLTDLNIKPINGFGVCKLFREFEKFQNVPIVGLTANVSPSDMRAMKKIGFSGVITKPINLSTFPVFLEQILLGKEVWED